MVENQLLDGFLIHFDSEDACAALLHHMKWPEGFHCMRCSGTEAYRISTRRLPLYECRACNFQHSLTVGTIMEGSRTPLHKWFAAIYLFATAKSSISALSLCRIIDVTYKTAWLILHKLRDALRQGTEHDNLLRGIVRVQGGAYGSPFNPYTESDPQRHPLLAGGTVNASGDITALRLQIVKPQHIEKGYITYLGEQSFIEQAVSSEAESITSLRFRMHMDRFRPLVRCIAEFGSWASEVFHGLGRKYLQSYANEYGYRFNTRDNKAHSFHDLLRLCSHVMQAPSLHAISQRYST